MLRYRVGGRTGPPTTAAGAEVAVVIAFGSLRIGTLLENLPVAPHGLRRVSGLGLEAG